MFVPGAASQARAVPGIRLLLSLVWCRYLQSHSARGVWLYLFGWPCNRDLREAYSAETSFFLRADYLTFDHYLLASQYIVRRAAIDGAAPLEESQLIA